MDAGDGVPKGLRESTSASLARASGSRTHWTRRGERPDPLRVRAALHPLVHARSSCAASPSASTELRRARAHARRRAPGERAAVRAALGDDDVAMLREVGHSRPARDPRARRAAHRRRSAPDRGGRHAHRALPEREPEARLRHRARSPSSIAIGVQLALGADGAPCNNNLDPWTELRHAALLAKVRSGVTDPPRAPRAFRLATIDGARALGLGDVTGSLETGKRADFVVVRLDGVHAEPGGDVCSKLVYACSARRRRSTCSSPASTSSDFGEHQLARRR